MVQATHRDDQLQSLALTFADAGSYFGYFDEKLPENLTRAQVRAELDRRLAARQASFTTHFAETREALKNALAQLSSSRPRENSLGKTRTLRAELLDYKHDNLTLRFLEGKDRLLRVLIVPTEHITRTWLDPDLASHSSSDRLSGFASHLTRTEQGDVLIADLPVVPQGYRPYCGLNTLAMAARYFGLHLDEDWLAVAGEFQNTGSAADSQMPGLYQAVAKEAELDMVRLNQFDLTEARRSLQQGLPVIVWRRFSADRDRAHTTQARLHAKDPTLALSSPSPAERETYPDENAPLHASVLVGYNDKNRELLFLESWDGLNFPRRMRAEELEATAYLTFCFRP